MAKRTLVSRSPVFVRAWLGAGVLALSLASPAAHSDTIEADPDAGYVPIDELSYETIIRPGQDYEAELAIRVALTNTSSVEQDMVLTLGVPEGATLTGVSMTDGGDWIAGEVSEVKRDKQQAEVALGRRDPGTIFARELPPAAIGELPAVELIGFGMASRATVQVELRLRVHPTLRGDRWQLDLPRRHADAPNLDDQRRVIVQGLAKGDNFYVDGSSSKGTPYMVTRAEDAITVSWPARLRGKHQLDGSYEYAKDPDGQGGRLRLVLNLGPSKALAPDHVVLVLDRSRSSETSLPREAGRMFTTLLDDLPAGTTFDAITFAKDAESLLDPARLADGGGPKARDEGARAELLTSLGAVVPGQGTDLRDAMRLAAQHLEARGAKRPLVLVVTDGMLPPSVGADEVGDALRGALGKAKTPEFLFVVDDPLLNVRGLPADHPIADLAAALGARISLETLANLGPPEIAELLAAPMVLGDLSVSLPNSVVLDEPPPTGLVAGDFVVLEGSYGGRPPSSISVRGRLGKSKVSASFKPAKRAPRPAAIAIAIREQDRAQAASEGLALPDWYSPSMRRTTTMNISQQGKVGWQATGQLDQLIIERQLRTRVLPRARACYNQALGRNQILAGEVELQMEAGKGEIMMAGLTRSTLNYDDDKLLECLERAAWMMDVPAGKLDTQVYVINYPLEFVPPEGGKPPSAGETSDPMFERLIESADVLSDYQNHNAE